MVVNKGVFVVISSKDLKKIQEDLTVFDEMREKMFETSRIVIRLSAWSIIQMHRSEMERAKNTLKEASNNLSKIQGLVKKTPELRQVNSVLVAHQEYTEAMMLYGILKNGRIASLKEVGVDSKPYILGLLDLIGELRRVTLNHLRRGRADDADRTLKTMEELYENLLSLDHTAIVPTFRVKADAARRIIESTRGDVITEVRRMSLEEEIRKLRFSMKSSSS